MADELVPITRLPEGESGRIIGCLTQERIEAIAAIYALPEQVRKKKFGGDDKVVRYLAGRLGVSDALIRRSRRDRRVRKLRDQLLNEAVEDLWPTIVFRMVERVMTSSEPERPFVALARAFGRMGSESPGVNVNVSQNNLTVNAGTPQDGGISRDEENKLWLLEIMESGKAQRLVDAMKRAVPAEATISSGDAPPSG